MKQTVFSLIMLAFAASAAAQAPNRAALEKAILANEMALTATFTKADGATMQKFFLLDAINVDPTGITPAADMVKMIAEIKLSPGWKIESSTFHWFDDNTVMHVYKWTGKGVAMGQPLPSPTWSSTLWVQRGGQWKAAFHQETSAMSPPPPAPAKK